MSPFKPRPLFLALVLLLAGVPLNASAQGRSGVDVFNDEIQVLWDKISPDLERELEARVRAQLGAVQGGQGRTQVSVRTVRNVSFRMREGINISDVQADRATLTIPNGPGWSFDIEADVRVKTRLWFMRPTFTIPIRLRVDRIKAGVMLILDVTTDPNRPAIQRVGSPQVSARIKLRSRNFLYDLLLRILTPFANRMARRAIDDAIQAAAGSIAALQGMPGPSPGLGVSPLVDSGAATPFEEVAKNIDRKLRAFHTPHGTILRCGMDAPASDSWLDAYRDGGTGIQGNVVDYKHGGDSAAWTGTYLGGLAFRYAQTGDPAALDDVRHALAGIGALLDVNGATGLLARLAAPENSLVGQDILRWGSYGRATINGQTWVGLQGDRGVSRDQYQGCFFGLALAHDLVGDPAVKQECAERIKQMLDYFVANNWLVSEDRPTVTATPPGSPTGWAGIGYQRATFLLIGERLWPGRYAAELARFDREEEIAWLAAWFTTFNLDHYYKFNLRHTTYYNYFRLETNPARYIDSMRGYLVIRRYVGHHRNAHFDLVATSADPSLNSVFFPAVRETLRRWLGRNHRYAAPSVVDLSNVQWVTYPPATLTLPSEPLRFDQRDYSGHFDWQRGPFIPAVPNWGDVNEEKPGIDMVVPYWMGRHLGAF